MAVIDINRAPLSRDLRIFALLWLAFMPVLGWVLTGMGIGLLVLAGVTGVCFALSMAFNNEQPRRRQLAAALIPLVAGAIWVLMWVIARDEATRSTIRVAIVILFIVTGVSGGAVAMRSGRFGTVLYRSWMMVVMPVGWTISHALLGAVYFGVVTPIGLVLRLAGHDPLHLRSASGSATFWTTRDGTPKASRYFRQF